jgi:hypothetical protein
MWACLDADWHTMEVLKLQMGQLKKEQTESYNREDQIKSLFYFIHKIRHFLFSQRATVDFKIFRSYRYPNLRVQLACFRDVGRNVKNTLFHQDTEQI